WECRPAATVIPLCVSSEDLCKRALMEVGCGNVQVSGSKAQALLGSKPVVAIDEVLDRMFNFVIVFHV
ncbi:hypothetical protein, partial [Thiomicrospira sp.]|uniref:hypothetical protein n=1 Tax=Thiomicrospira sp. TaxID=935 RepID=UPI0025CDF972